MRCHSERSLRSEESENTSKTIGITDVYRFFLPKVVRMKKNDLNLMRNSILALRSNESNSRMRFALFCDGANGVAEATAVVAQGFVVAEEVEETARVAVAVLVQRCGPVDTARSMVVEVRTPTIARSG